MTEHEEKDIRAYCSWIHCEFGIEFSSGDPTVPTMYVFHKEMESTVEANRRIAEEIKEATSRLKPIVYNFNERGESLKFQIGIVLKWILLSIPVSIIIWITAWGWSNANDIEQARMIIESSENVRVLANRVQKNEDGFYFIDFSPGRGDSTKPFTEFKAVNKQTMRVILGRDSSQLKK